jgi:hypothetical protein
MCGDTLHKGDDDDNGNDNDDDDNNNNNSTFEFSLGGSSPYTSTDKTNKNKYT